MCTSPLKGFKFGKTDKGADKYYIRTYATHHLEYDSRKDKILTIYDHNVNYANTPIHEYIEIPCGKCLECKMNYSRQWAQRCLLESKQYINNCFITLTYNDENLPVNDKGYKTLKKEHFQLFMKRLRKALEPLEIRFFACGEYGEQTKRPHYHAIIFNWYPDSDDLEVVGKNFNGDYYYSSKLLSEKWPYGFNLVANADYNSMSYVARYVSKKNYDYKEFYDSMEVENEFTLMSRKPGIGKKWFSDNKCYANFSKQFIGTNKDSITITSNKYFDKLLASDNPEAYERLKAIRKDFAEHKKKLKLENTSLPYLEQLKVDDLVLHNKTKILKRTKI